MDPVYAQDITAQEFPIIVYDKPHIAYDSLS